MQLMRSIGIACALGLGAAAYAQGGAAGAAGAQGAGGGALPYKTNAPAQQGPAERQGTASQALPGEAQQGMQQRRAEATRADQRGTGSVVGTVESVKQDTLSLKNRLGQTHQLQLSQNTKFTEHGKQISRDQIAQGDEVRAVFRSENGQLHATEIRELHGQQAQSSPQGTGSGGEGKIGQHHDGSSLKGGNQQR